MNITRQSTGFQEKVIPTGNKKQIKIFEAQSIMTVNWKLVL